MLNHVRFLSFSGSVDDIIDHYKKEQIVEGYNLKDPVSVQVLVELCSDIAEVVDIQFPSFCGND